MIGRQKGEKEREREKSGFEGTSSRQLPDMEGALGREWQAQSVTRDAEGGFWLTGDVSSARLAKDRRNNIKNGKGTVCIVRESLSGQRINRVNIVYGPRSILHRGLGLRKIISTVFAKSLSFEPWVPKEYTLTDNCIHFPPPKRDTPGA